MDAVCFPKTVFHLITAAIALLPLQRGRIVTCGLVSILQASNSVLSIILGRVQRRTSFPLGTLPSRKSKPRIWKGADVCRHTFPQSVRQPLLIVNIIYFRELGGLNVTSKRILFWLG